MEKNKFKSLLEEIRLNNFVNNLLKMNEEDIDDVVSRLNEETRIRVISILEAKLPIPKKAKVKVDDVTQGSQATINDLKTQSGISEPAADLKPTDLRAKYARGPVEDPTIAGKSQPAADLKPGDMRSQFTNRPPTDSGVVNADAAFKRTSQKIGADNRAKISAGANKYPAGEGLGNIKAKADTNLRTKARTDAEAGAKTDIRTKARTDAEAKAKKDTMMGDTVKKVSKGLAGAAALGTTAALLSRSTGDSSAPAAAEPAVTKMKVPEGATLSQIARKNKVSVADLMKANQGIKNVHKIGVGQELVIPKATNAPVYQGGIGTKAGPSMSQNMPKKRVNENSDNPLISAFLKIQASGSSNLFEAAKKAKKDYDGDGKVESGDAEWKGSRDKAIKAAMKEALDPKESGKRTNPQIDRTTKGDLPKNPLVGGKRGFKGGAKDQYSDGMSPREMGLKPTNEEIEISEARESFTKGTRKIKTYAHGDYHAEVRHNPDWQEYQVHFYKNGKHMGEGPVSYHGEDKEDAHDSAKAGLEFLNKRSSMSESVTFSEAELAHIASIAEGNPIAPVPDDYSGAAGGVSKRDLSDETVAEGIRGMRRKDSKFKDAPKRYSNEYPKSYREPGTMSKSEMRDHIESSVRKYLSRGGKIKKS